MLTPSSEKMHTVKSMRNDPELDEWPDETDVDEMEDVLDLFDLMEQLDISSKDLESVSELASRIKMHIWCKKYGNYKQMVWVNFFHSNYSRVMNISVHGYTSVFRQFRIFSLLS